GDQFQHQTFIIPANDSGQVQIGDLEAALYQVVRVPEELCTLDRQPNRRLANNWTFGKQSARKYSMSLSICDSNLEDSRPYTISKGRCRSHTNVTEQSACQLLAESDHCSVTLVFRVGQNRSYRTITCKTGPALHCRKKCEAAYTDKVTRRGNSVQGRAGYI
ncbi:MAG: hypothetical protein JWM11_7290, partial [Planctomycetaceae bacterium]|nr:hypothetical protein [Planctomycetaceae bacterium]